MSCTLRYVPSALITSIMNFVNITMTIASLVPLLVSVTSLYPFSGVIVACMAMTWCNFHVAT